MERFIDLIKQHSITAIADVRSAPYSRFHPQFNKDALAAALKKEGIAYVFLGKELGARPRACRSTQLRSASTYEDLFDFERIARTDAFKSGIERVVKGSGEHRIALMCAEKEPLDCHRTILVCHELKSFGVSIKHILYDGTLEDHHNAESRLLKLTNYEQEELFINDSKRLELAYKKRAVEIAYKASP
jgi:uncharacterized protein (DUF488 family)